MVGKVTPDGHLAQDSHSCQQTCVTEPSSPLLELGRSSDGHSSGVDQTIGQLTVNIANSVVGFAVLTLPSGMERLSDSGMTTMSALKLACALLVIFGAINAWTFALIGEACERTGAKSYTAAWSLLIGPMTAGMVTWSTLLISFINAVICQSIIGVTFTDILNFVAGTEAMPRLRIQAGVVLVVLLPLCKKLPP